MAGAAAHGDLGGLDDAAVLARHVAGDREAFGELFRRHRDRLWAVAVRTLGDREEAADALQDAMVSAYRAAGSFRGDSAVTTWLHRVVVNACLDRIRRRTTRPTVPLPEVETEPRIQSRPDAIAASDLRMTLRDALATLPDEQRAALVLVDVEGYSVEETARLLGVQPGTVKSRCARARAKLLPLVRHLREPDRGDADDRGGPSGSAGSGDPGAKGGNPGGSARVRISSRDDRREGGGAG
jgi:RNA polymerase sigma-70 factor (ECF subfamily)